MHYRKKLKTNSHATTLAKHDVQSNKIKHNVNIKENG
jgi:hypothetical protein